MYHSSIDAVKYHWMHIRWCFITPLVMASTGGLGPAASMTYKRLATLLAVKWNQTYNTTLSWLRCRLSFSLLRSSSRPYVVLARHVAGLSKLTGSRDQRVSGLHCNGHDQLSTYTTTSTNSTFMIVLVTCNSKVFYSVKKKEESKRSDYARLY